MVDFKKYLEKGLSAAERAEANKTEIDSVFEDLNQQMDEATNGKIFISIIEFYKNSSIADLASLANLKPREKYTAIAAMNRTITDCEYKQLAKWKIDRNGYPCTIILDRDEMYCEDKASLEKNLQRLLSDPVVGDQLYKLISMEPSAEEDWHEDEDDT